MVFELVLYFCQRLHEGWNIIIVVAFSLNLISEFLKTKYFFSIRNCCL